MNKITYKSILFNNNFTIMLLLFILLLEIFPLSKDYLIETSNLYNSKDWGLGYNENAPPTGIDSPEVLRQNDAYYYDFDNYNEYMAHCNDNDNNGDSDSDNNDSIADNTSKKKKKTKKVLYLTFDTGYENGYTASILDTLKEKKVPACFFLVGNYFKSDADLVKRMVSEGHIVGNHTMTHPKLSGISNPTKLASELGEVEKLYKEVTGCDMKKFIRPPSGNYSDQVLLTLKNAGYKTIFWSVAYVDWLDNKQPDHNAALNTIKSRVHPGAIILLHGTSKTNSEILGTLIDSLKNEGYTFKSLDYLIRDSK